MASNGQPKFTPANNFQGTNNLAVGSTYDTTYTNFGLSVYKNYDSYHRRNMYLNEHITSCVEMGCGAHYYSQGIYTSTYRKAETTINLSSVTVDTKNKRVACISLGVHGAKGSCDMGIETYDGTNWFAICWSGVVGKARKGATISGAAKVKITVEPAKTSAGDYVYGTFVWYNSSGSVLREDQLTCKQDNGSGVALFDADSAGLTIQRFHRFMSLIPPDGTSYTPQTDLADGSKLISGNLTNNKLYLANGSAVTWGTSLMDYIWSVQGWNISNFTPGNNDTFSCTHSHYMY